MWFGFVGFDFGFLLEEFYFDKYRSMRFLYGMMYFKSIVFFIVYGVCFFIGLDIKGNIVVLEFEILNFYEDSFLYFFEKYFKDFLVEVKERFWVVDFIEYF